MLSSKDAGLHQITVFDAVGRKVTSMNAIKDQNELLQEINLTDQGTGIYYAIVKDPFGNIQHKKFIIID